MTYDNHPNEEQNLKITDKVYQDLYTPELSDYEGPEKGGACMLNAYNTAEYLISQGVPRERLQFLYIVAPTPVGPAPIEPNVHTLRAEEQAKAQKKGGKTEWAYHAAVMTRDTKQVFDLSSDKKFWGAKLDTYMTQTFLNQKGLGNTHLRFIVTTLDSLDEMTIQKRPLELPELIRRGQGDEGGMSSIWMLQNKPEEEWYWKAQD